MRFTKMQGCGNDFIVIDEPDLPWVLDPQRTRRLCDRRFGIGADGVLVVGRPSGRVWPLAIHNADGSIAESCGNGARCVARYVLDRDGGTECELATLGGLVRARRDGDRVGIELAAPRIEAQLRLDGSDATTVEVGNPHVVVFVDDPARVDLTDLARRARSVAGDRNVGAASVSSRVAIRLRVDERGVGETLACGTGSCAAVAAAVARGLVDRDVSVTLPGGTLDVRAGPERYELWGPAERVFEGVL